MWSDRTEIVYILKFLDVFIQKRKFFLIEVCLLFLQNIHEL